MVDRLLGVFDHFFYKGRVVRGIEIIKCDYFRKKEKRYGKELVIRGEKPGREL
jgi:hypothetical protein